MKYKVEYRECSITDWRVKYFFTRRGALKFVNEISTRKYNPYDDFVVYERDKSSESFSYMKCKNITGWKEHTHHFS